jgi:hypothetical protein
MSAHHAKVSSAILFLLTASLLATACDNDPAGPTSRSLTAADTLRASGHPVSTNLKPF